MRLAGCEKRIGPAVGLLLLSLTPTRGEDRRIEPGRRLGPITLGMRRTDALRRLGRPVFTQTLASDVLLDSYAENDMVPRRTFEKKSLISNYVHVFFVRGRVIQIEATSPRYVAAGRMTTDTPLSRWAHRYHPVRETRHVWEVATVEGEDGPEEAPAQRHVVRYVDASQAGIAWKRGTWCDVGPGGALVPINSEGPGIGADAPPEAVIVHGPGQTLQLSPTDGTSFSGTGEPRDAANLR